VVEVKVDRWLSWYSSRGEQNRKSLFVFHIAAGSDDRLARVTLTLADSCVGDLCSRAERKRLTCSARVRSIHVLTLSPARAMSGFMRTTHPDHLEGYMMHSCLLSVRVHHTQRNILHRKLHCLESRTISWAEWRAH
jgi:hypothetical protein